MSSVSPASHSSPVDWARRVNRAWIVRARLGDNAAAYLDHLEALGDSRLEASCRAAQRMCAVRRKAEDPKPWFYSGLFSLATPEEAARFLSTHRITRAAIPATAGDTDVELWLDRVGPETRALMERLRQAISQGED